MKQGKTVLIENTYGMTPRVEVGTNDQAVWVDFGSMAVRVSMNTDGTVKAVCEGRRIGEYGSEEDAVPTLSEDGYVVTWAWPFIDADEEE